MESIGRLAGGVAHDFNNLLTVIRGYCEIMKEKTPPGAPLDKDLDQVMAAEQKAAALTSQLLAFSRKQILAPRLVSLNDLVSNLQKMLERIIGEDITLSTILESGLRSVFADPGQIEQVIMNFVVNARDAMPTGGVLTVETRNVDLDEAYGRSHFGVPLGPCVLLTFSDNGRGMDARVQAHIFEPFFSTKEPGKGTGLGLATSYGIVKQSGGEILAYSEPGRGTTFKIYLPAIQAEAESPAALQAPIASRGGTETILLVEDNDMVRSLAKSTLRAKGYNVLEAVDGRELAEELAPLRPNMKVLYMSGYTDDAVLRHGILAAGVEFISKPFMPSALAAKVRDVLDA
jgi:two-component system cell cycle sensor histidine kinase/response regulator CckA